MKTVQDFFDEFDKAFFECVDNGKQSRLTVHMDNRVVQIDICEAGKTQADFDKLLVQAVKNRVHEIKQ